MSCRFAHQPCRRFDQSAHCEPAPQDGAPISFFLLPFPFFFSLRDSSFYECGGVIKKKEEKKRKKEREKIHPRMRRRRTVVDEGK